MSDQLSLYEDVYIVGVRKHLWPGDGGWRWTAQRGHEHRSGFALDRQRAMNEMDSASIEMAGGPRGFYLGVNR